MLNFDLTSSAVLSGIPYLALSICVCCSGYLADWLQMKRILSTRNVRRIFCCGSYAIQASLMILVAFVIDKFYSVLILTFAVGSGALCFSTVTDSGFWIVKEYFGISVMDALKSYTLATCIASITAISITLLLSTIF